MASIPAVLVVLLFANLICRAQAFCYQGLVPSSAYDTLPADCRVAFAHLPAIDPNSFQNPITRFHTSLPFLPRFKIRHRSCLIASRWVVVPPELPAWVEGPLPRVWDNLRYGIDGIIRECVDHARMGTHHSQYFLVNDQNGFFSAEVSYAEFETNVFWNGLSDAMRQRIRAGGTEEAVPYASFVEELFRYTAYEV